MKGYFDTFYHSLVPFIRVIMIVTMITTEVLVWYLTYTEITTEVLVCYLTEMIKTLCFQHGNGDTQLGPSQQQQQCNLWLLGQ
jgi:hypothetical protein